MPEVLISIKRSYLIWLLNQFGAISKEEQIQAVKNFRLLREKEALTRLSKEMEVPLSTSQFGKFLTRGLKLKSKRRAEGHYCYLTVQSLTFFEGLLKVLKYNDRLIWDGRELSIEPEFKIGEGKGFEEKEEGID